MSSVSIVDAVGYVSLVSTVPIAHRTQPGGPLSEDGDGDSFRLQPGFSLWIRILVHRLVMGGLVTTRMIRIMRASALELSDDQGIPGHTRAYQGMS